MYLITTLQYLPSIPKTKADKVKLQIQISNREEVLMYIQRFLLCFNTIQSLGAHKRGL